MPNRFIVRRLKGTLCKRPAFLGARREVGFYRDFVAWIDFLKTKQQLYAGVETPASFQKTFPQGLYSLRKNPCWRSQLFTGI
jgi:hypothetical protein